MNNRLYFLLGIFISISVVTISYFFVNFQRSEPKQTATQRPIETVVKTINTHNEEIINLGKQLRSHLVPSSTEEKIKQLAIERKKYMSYLIEKDPTLAMEKVIRKTDKEILPSSVKPFIEDEILKKGTIEIFHEDYPKQNTAKESYFLKTNNETLQLSFAHGIPTLQPNQTIEVKGAQLDTKLLTLATSTKPNAVLAATTPTIKKIGVILFNFQNDTTTPETIEQIQDMLTTNPLSVNTYIQQSSYGQIQLTTDVVDIKGWYTIPFDSSINCNYHNWTDDSGFDNALSKAKIDGFDTTKYNHIIYISTKTTGCGFGGIATVGGKFIYMNGLYFPDIRESSLQISHELGHNLGLWHAHMLNCKGRHGEPTIIDGVCDVEEFGDSIDRMGSGDYTYNGINRSRLSWLLNNNIQTISQPGSYTLYSIEQPSTQTQMLKIPRIKDENIFVEYRKSYGIDTFPSTSIAEQGVSIRLGSDITNNALRSSIMINATPLISQNPRGLLTLNKTVIDPVSGIGIIVTSINADSATVLIKKNTSQCTVNNPSIDITPKDQKVMPNQSASYMMVVKNMDSLGCLPSSFEWKTILSDYLKTQPENSDWQKVTIVPGETFTKTFTITASSNAQSGIYPFQQIVHHYPQTQFETSVDGTIQIIQSETPYYTNPLSIPGVIQMEDFDNGGEQVAYHDQEPQNLGGQYRLNEGVDISTAQNGFIVSSTRATEWLKYTVQVSQSGTYTVSLKTALSGGTALTHLELDGQNISGSITIPNTNGWDNWRLVNFPVTLPAGVHILTFYIDSASVNGYAGNFDFISFSIPNTPTTTPTPTIQLIPTLSITPTKPIIDTIPPQITITSPTGTQPIQIPKYQSTQITAKAVDSSGIKTIQISADALLIKTCSNNPPSCSANYTFKPGTHVIKVTAVDNSTNLNTSTVSITIQQL